MLTPKELFGNDYSEFSEIDPFNPQNIVSGFISRKSTEYYGALIITNINGRELSPQLIMGTPKIHYPFDSREDGTRNYHFPIAKSIEIYEKLDGTNILAYFYSDGDNRYLTFKTRLRPFLSSSKFGDFYNMWREIASNYFVEIEREMDRSECNLSFELYGGRNIHLIAYPNPLAIALLFGVTNTGRILSPEQLKKPNLPTVKRLKVIDKDFVGNYELLRKELQAGLKQGDEGCYSGIEGTVWYMHLPDGRCTQMKCKPETVEAIHFSAGAGGLSKNIILATCWNGFENAEVITVELIKQLLLEEFDSLVIEAHYYLIEKCVDFVNKEAEFRNKVASEYKATGMNILLNKRDVMRQLSEKFPKDKIKKVYSIIIGYV